MMIRTSAGRWPTSSAGPAYRAAPDSDDHWLAHDLARGAGELLLELRATGSGSALGAEGDRRADEFLQHRLADRRPSDAVLSEESADDHARLDADRVWIIDPLDGTREFGQPGRADWAVHVALWGDGVLIAGAVALPAQDRVFSTWRTQPPPPDPDPRVLLVSRSRPPHLTVPLAERWGATVRSMGSAGAKAAAVLQGAGTAYVHTGGQYEWDSAAPVAVALAHGLRVRRLDGSAPRYNHPDPAMPDIVICRPSSADELWAALDELRAGERR
ncbi:3'(2'),5'-bisphosphate nucleotidase CysQ [Saccharothrix sp. AJ9571]|nr:3'(2'),5'-bisphosphate nucleotidase CysQ [Saccharothrix sp. AJ9571]